MKRVGMLLVSAIVVIGVSACASIRTAQKKTIDVGAEKFELGGTYDPRGNNLIITINGDPVMRGSFPPYTPTLRLNATYKNQPFNASCYFGSVLGSKGGIAGIVAGAVQGAKDKSADKCDVTAGSATEALFF